MPSFNRLNTPKAILASLLLSSSPMYLHAAPSATGTDQLIVKFDDQFANGRFEADRLSQAAGVPMSFLRETANGRLIFQLDELKSPNQAEGLAKALSKIEGISHAEPDIHMVPFALPNDPLLQDYQWHYFGPNSSPSEPGGLNATQAWENLNSSDQKAVVAILDTGSTDHSDLNANTIPGYDMISSVDIANDGNGRDSDPSDPGDNTDPAQSSSWHGTHVAGTVGAVTNNGNGLAGVGYDRVQLMHVRVLGVGGGTYSDISDAIYWATDNGANVINMSLGGNSSCDPNSSMQAAINYAVSNNVSVIVSAGNSNTNTANFTPASCSNAINVAAVNRSGGKANYSNYGDLVDIASPGGEGSTSTSTYVISTHNDGVTGPGNERYVGMAGTSMAAPHISGLAALLYSENTAITPMEIEQLIKENARSFPATCNGCGTGIADAYLAMQALSTEPPSEPEPTLQAPDAPSLFDASVNGSEVSLSWFDVDTEEWYELQVSKKARGKKWGAYADVLNADSHIAADTTSFIHSLGDGTYKYRLRASNSAGSSEWVLSEQISVDSSSTDDGSGSGSTKCHPKRGC
ncbi:S8 family serine peptidase [Neptuniibacter sp. QD34_54]|uniref:S8 family serine peptidase n=1 Tax=unclassified Neptuniibacter TaxID=2630693 RepID=UPI0039F6F653